MADEWDFYEGSALDPATRAAYVGVVTKKNRVKLPNGQIYVNLDEQVFQPYDLKLNNLVQDWIRTVGQPPVATDYLKNTDFEYYSSYDPSTFEGFTAAAIKNGGYADEATGKFIPLKTPGDVQKMVQSAWENGQFEFTDSDPLRYQGFAKGLWQEVQKATSDFNKDLADYNLKIETTPDPFTELGIPSPELRYDPRTFKGYSEWETKQLEAFKKKTGSTYTPERAESWVKGLRRAAADKYYESGYSPYRDAILALEANK